MQSRVGYSASPDIKAAVEEATRGISNPAGLIIMTDYERLPEISALIRRKFPNAETIGTTGTSYFNAQSSDHNLIITAFLEGADCRAGVITRLSSAPAGDLANLAEALQEIHAERENSVVIQYCTNDEERLCSTLDIVLGVNGIHMVGGSVFGYPEGAVGQVSVNGHVYEDACAFLAVKNRTGKVRVYRENIYGRTKKALPHIVTKVDLSNKSVLEIDHKPAAQVYSEELGIPRDQIIDNVLNNPIGRCVGDQIYISSMKTMLDNGGMTLFKRLNPNDTIYFLSLLDYEAVNKRTIEQVQKDFEKISLIVSCNCIYRYILFTGRGYYNKFLTDMARLGPNVGNIGGGEQFDKQHVNQTMVMAVFD